MFGLERAIGHLLALLAVLMGPTLHRFGDVAEPYGESRMVAETGLRGRHHIRVHSIQWVVRGIPSNTVVRIGSTVTWCPSPTDLAARPRIIGVHQVDRRNAVLLTAYVASEYQPRCLVAVPVEHTVHVRGGLGGRPLYDGSKLPPIRRWPK